MIFGFTALLVCQLLGETASRGLMIPVPGPVIGLVLLVLVLAWQARGGRRSLVLDGPIATVGDRLLAHLGLLFVPAGVGVIQYGALLRAQALALTLALIGSTLLTMVVTVLVFVGVSRLVGHGPRDEISPGDEVAR